MPICKTCLLEFPEDNFYSIKQKRGNITYRKECKDCFNSKEKNRYYVKVQGKSRYRLVYCTKCSNWKIKSQQFTLDENQCNDCKTNTDLQIENIHKPSTEEQSTENTPLELEIDTEQKRIEILILRKVLKRCSSCDEVKDRNEFYSSRSQCKTCVRIKENKLRREKKEIQKQETEDDGIGRFILEQPGEYQNELEKKSVNKLLTSMNWSYDEEKNIYYKEPLKDKFNNWKGIKPLPPKNIIREDLRHSIEKMTIDTIPYIKLENRTYKSLPDDTINLLIREHILNKMSVADVSKKYDIPYMTVHQYISLFYKRLEPNIT